MIDQTEDYKSIALELFELLETSDEIPLTKRQRREATDETNDNIINDTELFELPQTPDESKDDRSIALELFELPETPDEIPLVEGQRVVATGDVHGNFRNLKSRLMVAGLIDDNEGEYNWVGGNTVLVQLGDIVDRGDEELRCILLLCKLGRQAKKAGGAVVVLWGNHETMNANGDYQCACDYDNKTWSNAFDKALALRHGEDWRKLFPVTNSWNDPARWAAMEPGGLLSVPFLSKLKVMAKVGRSVFVHAGFYAEDIKGQPGGLSGMNLAMQEWILASFGDVRKCNSLQDPECLTNTLWMRDYSCPADIEPTSKDICEKVKLALESVDADRMVVGHTQQKTINAVVGGTVWRVDLENQDWRSNPCFALEIKKEHHASGSGDEVVNVLCLHGK